MVKRILLTEDDKQVQTSIANSLLQRGHTVITADDGEEALRKLRANLPDVFILDMVLPRLDGLALLSVLPTLHLERKPRIVALSPFRNEYIAKRALALGAAYVLPKPVELNRLHHLLTETIWQAMDTQARGQISQLLSEAGIALHTKGGLYLMEAISIVAQDYACVASLRERVYMPIAQKNDTKVENVERLVRHAIEVACTRGNLDTLHRLFGHTLRSETGKPTNAEFIAIYAENIRLRIQKTVP